MLRTMSAHAALGALTSADLTSASATPITLEGHTGAASGVRHAGCENDGREELTGSGGSSLHGRAIVPCRLHGATSTRFGGAVP